MSDASNDPEQAVLCDLAHKLVDQVALYGLAKEVAESPKIAEAIQRAKAARAQLLQDINAKIWLRGIPAIEQGTKLGAARHAFARLRTVTGRSDASAVQEVERGEDYLRDRIAKAADDERLTAHTRNYLQMLVSKISSTQEEFSELKHSLK